MRKERVVQSTPALDQQENTWWNENAQTIEQVWAHSLEIQKLIRLPYLNRAKAFFAESHPKSTIWEIGCGTGWVCRLIADQNFHVIGTDFSAAQIELAKQSAVRDQKDQYCKYLLTDATTQVEGHTGILIHALLHHLSKEELAGFFAMIQKQKSGTKVFMYEPTFTEATHPQGRLWALLFKQVLRGFRGFAHLAIKLMGQKQEHLSDSIDRLFAKAKDNAWFLSPKEVPFYETELNEYLERYFRIEKRYFVNYTDLDLAQTLVIHQLDKPNFFISKVLAPLATGLDRIFFTLNFRSVTPGQYFYQCIEMTIK